MGMLGNYEDDKDTVRLEELRDMRRRYAEQAPFYPETDPRTAQLASRKMVPNPQGESAAVGGVVPADMAVWLEILKIMQRQKQRTQGR